MSWSITLVGTKHGLKTTLPDVFDLQAAQVASAGNTEEQKDILAVKERALAAIELFLVTGDLNGFIVDASGNRLSGVANFKLAITPIKLSMG